MPYKAYNNGSSVIAVNPGYVAQSGETLFVDYPTNAQLTTAFVSYMAPAGPSNLNPGDFTVTASGDYTVPDWDGNFYLDIKKTASEATNVNLPANRAVIIGTPRVIYIKDAKGDASTNNIILVGTIDNNGNGLIRDNLSCMRLVDTGTFWRRS